MHTSIRPLTLALAALGLFGSVACSAGGDDAPISGLTLAITDAASDELSTLLVEVESFRLERPNGAVVGVLPVPVTVDLVSLTDLSQVLNVRSVPAGIYGGATVTFDFANALCVIAGNSTPAAILDSEGNPITGTLTLPLDLGGGALNALVGKHQLLELDFDLDQSVLVDAVANTVSIEPVLVLRVDPLAPKQLYALGELVVVDPSASSFTAEVKVLGGGTIGTVEFGTGPLTVYQIDGVPSLGAGGLAALAAKGAGTWLQVYGAVDPDRTRLQAFFVTAGTGTWNGGSDIVEGHVVARSGGAGTSATLTVHGRSNDAGHTVFQFNTSFTVTTDFVQTKVVRAGSPLAYGLDAVNVGQRVRVFGSLAGTAMAASGPADVIRLQPTFVFGYATGAPVAGLLTLDVARIGFLDESAFTWSGSGSHPPDPAAFTVDAAGLVGGLGLVAGTATQARGWIAPVDDAGADLAALSVTNLESAPSLLFVRNLIGVGLDLTLSATPTQVQLGLAGLAVPGEAALIDKGFVGALPLPASPAPTIEPPTSGLTIYLIRDEVLGSTALYLDFAQFSSALALAVAQGADVVQVAALGTYSAGSNKIESPLASVHLR